MNEIVNQRKYYKVVSEALAHCSMSEKIREISNTETLDFEISAIAQAIDVNNTESKLSEFISKFINQSFDGNFKASEFVDAAREILRKYN